MFVHHLQYVGWMTNGLSASTNLLKFIDDVTDPLVPIASTAGPMVVQSRLERISLPDIEKSIHSISAI